MEISKTIGQIRRASCDFAGLTYEAAPAPSTRNCERLAQRLPGMRITALSLVLVALAVPASAAEPTGRWRSASGNVEVEIAPCGAALCGTIVRVLSNRSMADPSVEMPADQPGLGLVVLSNFLPAADGSLEGFIYDRASRKPTSCSM